MQNFIKTIINGVQKWTKKEIKKSTADWNQNDASADNYVKNRTHWIDDDGIIHKLNSKYLDLPDNLATTDDVESATNNKMNKANPVGTGTFSINGSATGTKAVAIGYSTKASGEYSYAEGYFTNASKDYKPSIIEVPNDFNGNSRGHCTHAEGGGTVASSIYSHAEGRSTAAYGSCSHAEGDHTIASAVHTHAEGVYTTASGQGAHAEGNHTTASGDYSHAEGAFTTASRDCSHAEGDHTIASGSYSHAEGSYTIAQTRSQHVQGKYNILDNPVSSTSRFGKYAHIVGNGTGDIARSNAHTLDWNGVGWFQGGLQVGGNGQDDGAKNVLVEGDAIPIPENATVGQTIAVKSVDENGKPTEWETADPFVLTDENTGAKYKLSIVDGKLTMTEVTA